MQYDRNTTYPGGPYYPEGTIAALSCPDGQFVSGNSNTTCGSDGLFSGGKETYFAKCHGIGIKFDKYLEKFVS